MVHAAIKSFLMDNLEMTNDNQPMNYLEFM